MQIVSAEDNLHGMSNPVQTIFMKCQNLFTGKKQNNNFKMLSAENFTQGT